MPKAPRRAANHFKRRLTFEGLEQRLLLADLDDSLDEAISLGAITTTAKTQSKRIDPDSDVDMYRLYDRSGGLDTRPIRRGES